MKKQLLLATIAIISLYANAETYKRVTEAPADWSGSYIAVYESSDTEAFVFNATDDNNNYKTVALNNHTVSGDFSSYLLTIAKSSDGSSYTIKRSSGNYMGTKSNGNGINFDSAIQKNTITMSEGYPVITGASGFTFQFNAEIAPYRFSYFASTQKPICLYRLTDEPAMNISAPNDSIEVVLGSNATQTISVTTQNISGAIAVSVIDETGQFKVSPASMQAGGGDVTVTYTGLIAGEYIGKLVLSYEGVTAECELMGYTAHAGTAEDPMTITDAIKLNSISNNSFISGSYWVEGQITGYFDDSAIYKEGVGTTRRSIAISDTNGNLLVDLPSGSEVRKNLNLVDHPELLGEYVRIYGSFGKYKGVNVLSLSNVTDYSFDTATIIDNVSVDGEEPVEYYNLQGVKMEQPEKGVFIKKKGSVARKVVL